MTELVKALSEGGLTAVLIAALIFLWREYRREVREHHIDSLRMQKHIGTLEEKIGDLNQDWERRFSAIEGHLRGIDDGLGDIDRDMQSYGRRANKVDETPRRADGDY